MSETYPAAELRCAATEHGVPCRNAVENGGSAGEWRQSGHGERGQSGHGERGQSGHGERGEGGGGELGESGGERGEGGGGELGESGEVRGDGGDGSGDGGGAGGLVLPLCWEHLVAAGERVAGEVGVTDALPGPCPACGSRLGVRYPSGWLCAVCEWRWGEMPDPAAVSVRVDVVYYLRWRDRIKIGTSSNPRGRLAQLRHDELLAFERGDRTLEQRRHREFAELRLGGEWFAAADPLLAHVAAVAAGTDDPWALLARWRSEAAALAG
ncbi:GIY-YIG nuclease family protein [Herbiconiux liukaitaii]|uniref:GIY-YIG nuclease family protein n=1 Tax=Herbiconiux liukaitaii TaxID=3342799 RepID=UPI0035BADAA5